VNDNKNIKKGPPKRNPACYKVMQDLIIPAGTILRGVSENDYEAQIGSCGKFSISDINPTIVPGSIFKKVTVA
jgi:hypothetical protein